MEKAIAQTEIAGGATGVVQEHLTSMKVILDEVEAARQAYVGRLAAYAQVRGRMCDAAAMIGPAEHQASKAASEYIALLDGQSPVDEGRSE
jgi:hypothetical protein